MKFLIAGLGSIGRRHLRNLVSLGEKNIILYRTNLSTLPDEELQPYRTETDIKKALDHQPDAVIISNPTSLHLDIAIPAAEKGCHILLEKPISNSLKGIKDLKKAIKKGGGKILVGFHYRFHPTLQRAYNILNNNEIGKIVSLRANWGEYLPDWHPWEDYKESYAARKEMGGGVVLTLCHPFDYLSWLLGKPIILWSETDTRGELGIKVEDSADIVLRFPKNTIGTLHLDFLEKPPNHKFEIIGTKGTLNWDNKEGLLKVFFHKNSKWEYFYPPNGFNRNHMFMEEMKHFISIIKTKNQPICNLDDGINALEIALKILSNSFK